ncbi:RNA polymerase sigma-70 factor [Olivibacter ginsenosidimutans]|uniref:RNA polymerase sigma-70 factor n=1 Tax=Olivibacter ginsenosidimutans TaxID=1176537 RepID=A0ABP9B5P1_9SPHI
MEVSDSKLILSWQQGNDHAFEIIYKRYALRLLALAVKKTGNRQKAEDLVQDVFVVLFKHRSTADKISCLSAYLRTILKNKILDDTRRLLVQHKYEDQLTHLFRDEDYSTSVNLEAKESIQLVFEQIEKLPPQCRDVFKLSRQDYLTNKQIANLLKISENTVEQHIRKALRRLKTTIPFYRKTWMLIFLFLFC